MKRYLFSGLGSAFDVGTKGYGTIVGRTSIMAIIGGTFAKLGGGKFANGALSAAFYHLFNGEVTKLDKYTKAKLNEIKKILQSRKLLEKVIPIGQFALLFDDNMEQFIWNNLNASWEDIAKVISVLPAIERNRIINICDYAIVHYEYPSSTANYKLETFWRDMKNGFEQK